MNAPWKIGRNLGVPPLRESNEMIDDAVALRKAFDRDGYWFFRDVIDHNAVAELRRSYIDELVELGLIDADDPDYRYNGKPLDALPRNPVSGIISGMFARAPWKKFVETPSVAALFRKILAAEPAWMPILGYRVGKPGSDPNQDRYEFVHQDGFFNPGIPFLNCWIPLVEMDEEVGGLAVAEGYHRRPNIHEKGEPPEYLIPVGEIPESAWRRANYRPGDLLVLHLDVPHTGISNVSADRFRMSIDLRMLPSSDPLPIIGKVVEASTGRILIQDQGGDRHVLTINEQTYCRGNTTTNGARIGADEIPANYPAGTAVIVAHEEGRATVVRPSSY